MFILIRKAKRRLRRILKVKAESRQPEPRSVHSRTRKVAMLVTTALLIGLLYPAENLYDPLDMPGRGEISGKDIVAPSQITVYKTGDELADEKEVVRLTAPIVLDCDTTVPGQVVARLQEFFRVVDSLQSRRAIYPGVEMEQLEQELASRFPLLPRNAVRRSIRDSLPAGVVPVLEMFLNTQVYRVGVVPDASKLADRPNRNVLVRRGERENVFLRQRVMTVTEANLELLNALNAAAADQGFNVEYGYAVGRIIMQPNLSINDDETRRRLDEDMASISNVNEIVPADYLIVPAGARVNARQQRVLEELAAMMRAEAAEQGQWRALLPAFGRIVLVLAVLVILYTLLYFYRREIYNSNPKLLAIFLVFGLQLFLLYVVRQWDVSVYLYPVAILPIVITILFDAEIGIVATIVLALMLGIMHRFDFNIALMTMTVGTVASLSARIVRRRIHFFRIAFAVALAYGVFVLLVESLKFNPAEDIFTEAAYGLINGVISTILTLGVLPLFESLFGITTDITLLELSDMNHPLLRRLAIEAPGTYQHSLVVGNLCEAAAKKIHGNALLARVGAYYHDIGKIEIPEYFVENQLSIKSRHEDLSASMSSLILSSHVKRGRHLGEEFDIPDDVLNFIEEHHGTMLMSYFYNKAIEQGIDRDTADKLRYPGPKPQTRETGIAMVADAVEAASRTLEDPKPARIDALIQRIINDRFQSGELGECPLTLRDLARIKEAFAQVLIAAFHHRVVYPGQPKEKSSR